jgi:hypothetical protein
MQSSETMKINESESEIVSRIKRSLSVRLVRSGYVANDNETMYSMSTTSQDFVDDSAFINDLDGVFHEPSPVANNNLEALCGNLSGK